MKRNGVLVLIVMAVLAVGSGSAVADQHNQRSCEAAGGTWDSDRGTKTCTFVEEETGKNERFECITTETDKGQGNLKNRPESESSEEGTGTGSGKCPPGQFPG